MRKSDWPSIPKISIDLDLASWNKPLITKDWGIERGAGGGGTRATVKWYSSYFLDQEFFHWFKEFIRGQAKATVSKLCDLFSLHFLLKNKTNKQTGEWPSVQRSKVTLLFSLACSVDFFMLSPHIWPAFLALIPPSFTSFNLFEKFFKPLQSNSSSYNWGKYENSRFNSDSSGYI